MEEKFLNLTKDAILITCNKMVFENINFNLFKDVLKNEIINSLLSFEIGYSYVAKDKMLKLENSYKNIDIVMFNIKLNSYVLININLNRLVLKDLNKLRFYIYYCDYDEKEVFNNRTIRIIVNKKSNH